MLRIKVVNKSNHQLPKHETALAAGLDLRADLMESVVLKPLERNLIGTGLYMELPEGFEAQIRPRSGLAFKRGLTVLNSPGTIDADYRGEVKVALINLSNEIQTVENGERIAQMVVGRHETVEFELVQELTKTERGSGGYGHTGVN